MEKTGGKPGGKTWRGKLDRKTGEENCIEKLYGKTGGKYRRGQLDRKTGGKCWMENWMEKLVEKTGWKN